VLSILSLEKLLKLMMTLVYTSLHLLGLYIPADRT